LDEPNKLEKIEKQLQATILDKSIARSKPFFLEITEKGIDKAASLDYLAKKLQVQPQEIVAIGNAANDLSMIQYAGLGIWVDNVTPQLRHLADDIVASNMNDGVTEAVKKYFKN
jgi:hydroxymethylpyrimidine pyrophosphatase-like HAD family hydrolase